MEIETILTLINSGVSFLALLLSVILKRKTSQAKSLEQIAEEANAKAQKYITKQCKKNKISLDTKSDNNQNNNSITTEIVESI